MSLGDESLTMEALINDLVRKAPSLETIFLKVMEVVEPVSLGMILRLS